MSIRENLSKAIRSYQRAQGLSLREFARECGIAWSSMEEYANGKANPRADTLDLLAEKLGVPITELVSGPPPGREQAETVVCAATLIGNLPPEKREAGIKLFLELAALYSEEDRK